MDKSDLELVDEYEPRGVITQVAFNLNGKRRIQEFDAGENFYPGEKLILLVDPIGDSSPEMGNRLLELYGAILSGLVATAFWVITAYILVFALRSPEFR